MSTKNIEFLNFEMDSDDESSDEEIYDLYETPAECENSYKLNDCVNMICSRNLYRQVYKCGDTYYIDHKDVINAYQDLIIDDLINLRNSYVNMYIVLDTNQILVSMQGILALTNMSVSPKAKVFQKWISHILYNSKKESHKFLNKREKVRHEINDISYKPFDVNFTDGKISTTRQHIIDMERSIEELKFNLKYVVGEYKKIKHNFNILLDKSLIVCDRFKKGNRYRYGDKDLIALEDFKNIGESSLLIKEPKYIPDKNKAQVYILRDNIEQKNNIHKWRITQVTPKYVELFKTGIMCDGIIINNFKEYSKFVIQKKIPTGFFDIPNIIYKSLIMTKKQYMTIEYLLNMFNIMPEKYMNQIINIVLYM